VGTLNPAVICEVTKRFQAQDARIMLQMLDAASLPLLEAESRALDRARVQLAAIKEARGDLGRFKKALDLACIDWRDLLMATGLADENWRAVLEREGYSVP
jgi:hypothetical protein